MDGRRRRRTFHAVDVASRALEQTGRGGRPSATSLVQLSLNRRAAKCPRAWPHARGNRHRVGCRALNSYRQMPIRCIRSVRSSATRTGRGFGDACGRAIFDERRLHYRRLESLNGVTTRCTRRIAKFLPDAVDVLAGRGRERPIGRRREPRVHDPAENGETPFALPGVRLRGQSRKGPNRRHGDCTPPADVTAKAITKIPTPARHHDRTGQRVLEMPSRITVTAITWPDRPSDRRAGARRPRRERRQIADEKRQKLELASSRSLKR